MAATVLGTAQLSSNAKVGFRTGLQSKMDTLLAAGTGANATPGYFYLTSDTHRLYVGNDDKSISPVNEGITTISSIGDLPVVTTANRDAYAGQFYYISTGNILCVYSGTNWVQINQVIDTYVGKASTATSVSGNAATLTTTIENWQNSLDGTTSAKVNGKDQTATVKISTQNGLTVTNDSDSKGITIGDSRTLTASANATAGVDIAFGDGTNKSSVNIVSAPDAQGSTNNTIAYNATDNQITISTKDTHVTSATINNGSADKKSTQGFSFTLKNQDNSEVPSSTIDPSIKIGTTTIQEKHFVNGVADFSSVTYSKADIDALMQGLNAMHYKGTVGTNGSAGTGVQISGADVINIYADAGKTTPKTEISVGDTFLSTDSFTIDGTVYGPGTLLIAQGTEDASTGYITSNLKYSIVQESHNTDTQYKLIGSPVTDGYKVALKEANSTQAEEGNITVKGSTYITVAGAETGTDPNKTETLTITHKDSAYTGTPTSTTAPVQTNGVLSFDIISGITTDSAGHITAAEKKTVTYTDGTMSGNAYSTAVNADNSVGTITNKVTYKRSDNSTSNTSGSTTVESSTLKISANTAATGLVMDMVWGTFD